MDENCPEFMGMSKGIFSPYFDLSEIGREKPIAESPPLA
jgi:hypothetical protein